MAGPTTLFQTGVHGSLPAATAGCVLYACTTHSKVYRSDGTTWTDWMTIPTGASMATDTLWDAAGDLAVGSGADTAARLALGAAGTVLRSSGSAVSWGHASGIVQVKTAVSTADDATTLATMQNSSLSLAFTPIYADSILHVRVDGEFNAYRSAGTITTRYGWVGIYNSTNSSELVREVRGDNLVAASAVSASLFAPIALSGFYTVNSTAARTFVLQYMSGEATNCTASIRGTRTGGVRMTISEVRP